MMFWIAGAATSVAALLMAREAVFGAAGTPIDRALPLLALAIVVAAWLVRETKWWPAVLTGVPLLAAAAFAFPEERARLFAYGLIVAAAYCGGINAEESGRLARAIGFLLVGLTLLRWLRLTDANVIREGLVAAGAVAILVAMRWRTPARTPALPLFIALAAAVATPAIPLRTIALPFLVAAVVALLPLGRLRILEMPALFATALLLSLFAWSGIVARGLPYFWRWEPLPARVPVAAFLAPGESATIDLPPRARWLVASGANVPRLDEGHVIARIDPGAIPIRIGAIADWGSMRREHFFASRNSLPERPAGIVRDYGYAAWVDGAGRVALPRGASKIRVTVDPSLRGDVRLQIESVEVEP